MSTSPDACEVCGFVREGVTCSASIAGIDESIDAFIGVIQGAGADAVVRPESDRWSIVEYGAHLRDVLLSLRERTIVASVVDHPTGSPIYRDERVNLGFYSRDSIDDVINELRVSAGLLTRTIASLPEGFERRTLTYSPLFGGEVTIEWMAAQAFHEASHHLGDVRENLRLLQVR
jgi:hypothetical protein